MAQELRGGSTSEAMGSRMPSQHEMERMARQGYEAAEHQIAEHPLASAVSCFGLGFGLGLMLSMAIGRPRRRRGLFQDRKAAEQIGQQILESLSGALPESVSRRMQV